MSGRWGFIALCLLPLSAFAGDTGKAPNEVAKALAKRATTPSVVRAFLDGAAVSAYGHETGTPEALITAARQLADVPAVAQEPKKQVKSNGDGTVASDKADGLPIVLEPKALLREAQGYAAGIGNKELIKYVDAVAKAPLAPSGTYTGSAKYTISTVSGGFTDVYEIGFAANDLAELGVLGDGDTDLDIAIFDEYGNRIAADTSSTDLGIVSWTPRWSGNFRIEIRNNGAVPNHYIFVVN